MSSHSTMVVVFPSHMEAESFIEQLQRDGFNMRSVSLVGRDTHADDQDYWQRLGAYWGQVWGCLFGASFLGLPGIGPLVVGGRLAREIMEAIHDVEDAHSVLTLALGRLGIRGNAISRYEQALRQDRFLVIAACPAGQECTARLMIARIESCGGEVYLEEATPSPINH